MRHCSELRVVVFMVLLLSAPALLRAASVDLARTGQITCADASGGTVPCAGTGQDGEIQAGLAWPDPRFTDNGDGTVTDNLTSLIWLADPDCFGGLKWFDAVAAVNALANGACGLSDGSTAGDWRMPNIVELMSPAHLGVSDFFTWLESFGFEEMEGYGYWSSTTNSTSTGSVFGYQFNHRFGGSYLKSGGYRTWPVRGVASGPAKLWKTGQTACFDQVGNSLACAGTGQDGEIQAGVAWPDPRFADNGDGTVTDNLTDLIWVKQAGCLMDHLWSDALLGANTLKDGDCGLTDGSFAGDWRLPNTGEITSLVDFSRYPALPAAHPFTDLPNQYHWTSTTFPVLPDRAYMSGPVFYGYYFFISKTTPGSVWPVRGGNMVVPRLFVDGFESGDTSTWSRTVQ
jgi:hypothetical protein